MRHSWTASWAGPSPTLEGLGEPAPARGACRGGGGGQLRVGTKGGRVTK